MIDITGTTITMTRGDTLSVTVGIYQGAEPYEVKDGDVVRFAMKKKYSDPEPLILRVLDNATLHLQLDPEDTEPLDYGSYVYDIEITMADGTVDTFIAKAQLILTEEVHQWN